MESASVGQWLLLLLAVAFADISVLADTTTVTTAAKFVSGTPTPSIASNTTPTAAPTTGSSNTTALTTNTTAHATTANKNTSSTVVPSTTKGASTSSSGSNTTASAATSSTKAVTKTNESISTDTPSTAAVSKRTSKFDLGSFIGGIILTLGLFIVLYLACRFYNSRRGVRYRTIDEHEAII
ncbi:porimin [Microcaecilia unicolor]|uniref:Porimin n=1 Tax=Microcaecilia unicolor TaxID=1415580 RepID=A0A6P7XZB4_9AMPH|nr:porimin [Microcaecilia unicolor]